MSKTKLGTDWNSVDVQIAQKIMIEYHNKF